MDNQIKICFIGKIRSGKSAAVNYTAEKLGRENVEIVDFGDELRNLVKVLYPDKNGKNRKMLQTIGQHMRELDEDIWIRPVEHKIKNSNKKYIICSSCRQQNEYDFLNKIGFLFIKIDCLDSIRVMRSEMSGDVFNINDFLHETEMEVDNFKSDYVISNNSDLISLQSKIDLILKYINEGEFKIGNNGDKI